MRKSALLAALLAVSACQSTGLGGPTADTLTPAHTATATNERVAECGQNELSVMAAASQLKTRVELGGAGSSRPYRNMFVRLVKEGGAGDMPWTAEARARKDPAMDAAWKAAGERPSKVSQALELGEPDKIYEAVLAASPELIDLSRACVAEAMTKA